MINRVYAPTKVNNYTKNEKGPVNIVVCRMVTRAGRTGGQETQATTISCGPHWPKEKLA